MEQQSGDNRHCSLRERHEKMLKTLAEIHKSMEEAKRQAALEEQNKEESEKSLMETGPSESDAGEGTSFGGMSYVESGGAFVKPAIGRGSLAARRRSLVPVKAGAGTADRGGSGKSPAQGSGIARGEVFVKPAGIAERKGLVKLFGRQCDFSVETEGKWLPPKSSRAQNIYVEVAGMPECLDWTPLGGFGHRMGPGPDAGMQRSDEWTPLGGFGSGKRLGGGRNRLSRGRSEWIPPEGFLFGNGAGAGMPGRLEWTPLEGYMEQEELGEGDGIEEWSNMTLEDQFEVSTGGGFVGEHAGKEIAAGEGSGLGIGGGSEVTPPGGGTASPAEEKCCAGKKRGEGDWKRRDMVWNEDEDMDTSY